MKKKNTDEMKTKGIEKRDFFFIQSVLLKSIENFMDTFGLSQIIKSLLDV